MISSLLDSPHLILALVLSVVFVNGFTDAPNAIAACVSSHSLSPAAAVLMAAVCNLAGAVLMTLWNARVAETVLGLADFGDNPAVARHALCVGMVTVTLWALAAWRFGIPTSESHALLAALSGAAVAVGGFSALRGEAWLRVGIGLLVSTLPAYLLGQGLVSLLARVFARVDRRRALPHFIHAQRLGAAVTAFLHGAQDGQKFLGVMLLGLALARGQQPAADSSFASAALPAAACGLTMAAGTMLGGGRIIKRVGMEMTRLDPVRGTAADGAAGAVLLLCSLAGLPVSTTHAKTCAIMGAGRAHGGKIRGHVVLDMVQAWIFTFPACAVLGYVLTRWLL